MLGPLTVDHSAARHGPQSNPPLCKQLSQGIQKAERLSLRQHPQLEALVPMRSHPKSREFPAGDHVLRLSLRRFRDSECGGPLLDEWSGHSPA